MNLAFLACSLVVLLASSTAVAGKEQQPGIVGYDVRESRILEGAIMQSLPNIADVKACSMACTAKTGCNSFTYIPSQKICEFKAEKAFQAGEYAGYISGISTRQDVLATAPPVAVTTPIAAPSAAGKEQQPGISGYDVRESRILGGAIMQSLPNIADAKACSTACTAQAGCNSFTYIPSQKVCEFKADAVFQSGDVHGYISGISVSASFTVVFTNTSGSNVAMYFVDEQGKEDPIPYTQIANGASYTQIRTKAGQSWRFKAGTALVAEYKVLPVAQQAFSIPASTASLKGYEVKESRILEGAILQSMPNVGDLQSCAAACTAKAGCNSFTYIPGKKVCEFKADAVFQSGDVHGYISGISISASFTVVFTNTSGSNVAMYFVDEQGKEDPIPYTQIANGASYTQIRTKAGQSWRFKAGTALVAEYKVLPVAQQAFSIPASTASLKGYEVKESRILEGAILQSMPNVGDLQSCAAACTAKAGCNSFTYIPSRKICEFKAEAAFQAGDAQGYISGIAVDAEYRQWLAKDQPRFVPKYQTLGETRLNAFNIAPLDIEQFTAYGYHIFRMNPLNLLERGTKTRVQIFEVVSPDSGEYHLDAGVLTPNTFMLSQLLQTKGDESTNTFFSQSERTDKFSINVSLDVGKAKAPEGAKGPKIGGKYSQEDVETSSSGTERTAMMATRWGAKFSVTALKRQMQLSSDFKTSVQALLNADYKDYVDFFETFGTHYPLRAMLGGMAFYEKLYSADEIGKAISHTTSASASATVPVKAAEVSAEVGFSRSKEESSKEKNSSETGKYWAIGGSTGADYPGWSLGDQSKDFAAIKVDLREIWELIWPEKMGDSDATAANNTLKIQKTMKSMLARYLDEEQRSISESPSYRPRMFSVRVDMIKLVEDLDDGSNGPDFWGYVSLYASRLGRLVDFVDYTSPGCSEPITTYPSLPNLSGNGKPFRGCDRWKIFGKDLADTLANVDTKSIKSDFPDVNKKPVFVSIAPTVEKIAGPQGSTQYSTNYNLAQYRLFPHGYFRDDDDGGQNADDWMTLDGSNGFTLQEVVDAGGSKTGTVTQSAAGLGKVEVIYTVNEIKFTVQGDKIALPDWPAN